MSERILVITVGKSLFASASWKWDGPLLGISDYRQWVQSKEFRKKPGLRQTLGFETVDRLHCLLKKNDPAKLVEAFDWDPSSPMRYSGELSTLMRMFKLHGAGMADFETYLAETYGRIELVCSDNETSDSSIAAHHLEAILGRRLGHPKVCVTSGVLCAKHLHELIPQFRTYLSQLTDQPVDLVVTGGYKAFAMVAGLMLAPQWRLFYLHDAQDFALIEQGWTEKSSSGEREMVIKVGSLPGTRFPAGRGFD